MVLTNCMFGSLNLLCRVLISVIVLALHTQLPKVALLYHSSSSTPTPYHPRPATPHTPASSMQPCSATTVIKVPGTYVRGTGYVGCGSPILSSRFVGGIPIQDVCVGVWWPTTHHWVTQDSGWWASTHAELGGKRKGRRFILVQAALCVIPYVQLGVWPCVGLICMIVCTREGAPYLSLYRPEHVHISSPNQLEQRSSSSITETNFP
jgi:hypothetical protein